MRSLSKVLPFYFFAALLFPQVGAAVLDLGEAQGFNAVIFGDHTATIADAEGRLAVGGNAQYPSSYSVGHAVIGIQNPQSNGTRNDLVVQGNVNLPSGLVSVDFGNVQIGGSQTGSGSFSQGNGNTTTTGVPNFAATVFDFAAVRTQIDSYSVVWDNLTPNGTVSDVGFELGLTGSDPQLNVFDVTADQWNLFGSRVIDVPVGSTVIINISGSNVTTGGGDIRFGATATDLLDPADYRANVIYNLNEATTLQSDSFSWEGAVFAPNATLTANGGAINGQAFFDSVVQQNGFEFHNFSTDAEFAPIPEPSAGLLFGSAITFLGFSRRRRNSK